jgi:CPA2 family monovalent cation:H+ antiporter-2
MSFSDLTLNLPDIEISTIRVGERSAVDGKSLAQLELRRRSGVSILAIRRGERVLSNPGADTQLLANDVVAALGTPDKIAVVMGLFHALEERKIQNAVEEHPMHS